MGKMYLTARQFAIMTFAFFVGTSILIAPSGLVSDAKQNAWMSALLGGAFDLALAAMYVLLMKRTRSGSFLQMNEALLGKWGGRVMYALFLMFSFLLTALLVGDLGSFLTAEIMQETPVEATQIFFLLSVTFAARLGIQTLARTSELLFPCMLLFLIVLVVAVSPQIDVRHLSPLMEGGVRPVLKGSYNYFGLQELIVMMMLYPMVRNKAKAGPALYAGVVLGSGVMVLVCLLSITTLGVSLTVNNVYPTYAFAKMINIGSFLQRIEGVLIAIWVFSIFVKTSICFIVTLIGFQELFQLKNDSSFIRSFGVLVFVLALISYTNIVFVRDFIGRIWAPFSILFLIVLPLILLAASLLRRNTLEEPGTGRGMPEPDRA
ncbi:endospore germination permease [Paenibacillus athensensis]|nr:endospore germination permease [Paenibacillus athensensis]MCD1258326.1 endospore germination permease [Paenibacillus athensensis]